MDESASSLIAANLNKYLDPQLTGDGVPEVRTAQP
jgi:hypothetical protein